MFKKLLTGTVVAGTLLSGVVAAAPSASAAELVCRSDWTAPDQFGVQLDPCYDVPGSDGANIDAWFGVGTDGRDIDPCAQLVNVATGAWAFNYGCIGWKNSGSGRDIFSIPSRTDFSSGTYVVQVGYWAYDSSGNLHYYDNAQSPRITV